MSFDALQLEKVLTRCLSFRHCRDCFNVLQNHSFRQYFLPMCLFVVAVSLGIKTRLKQCHLVVLMNTIGTVLSILCISIVTWASAHFVITCFCLLRLCLIETSPCCIRKVPMCELLHFGLIRELQLSTNHFHRNTDGSTKLDYDKCILISMESSLNERLASRALVILGSLIAEFMFGKVSCAGFCRQAFLCPASNFPRP